jgi:hypothetical protein
MKNIRKCAYIQLLPGHGKFGNEKLLDYTIKLFKEK